MDEEQTAFGQFNLSNFKKWSSTALETFDKYSIRMSNNSDNISMS